MYKIGGRGYNCLVKTRLSKVLAAAGVASRRASEELIFEGRVSVNGVVMQLPQTLVSVEEDRVTVDGVPLRAEEPKVYYLLHKPVGYLCSNTPTRRPVLHFFSHLPFRLFTVGRLDRETAGLLLVTNDGTFAHRVIHPSFGITKEYLAKTGQEITPEHLATLSAGTFVEGAFVRPLSVRKVRRGTVKVVVAEGRKHEVRALLQAARLTVRELLRIRVGPLTLGALPPGAYRELTPKEVAFFLPDSVEK